MPHGAAPTAESAARDAGGGGAGRSTWTGRTWGGTRWSPCTSWGLNLWRDVVVRSPRLQPRLSSTLLAMVSRERAGDMIDRALMRSVTMAPPPPPPPPNLSASPGPETAVEECRQH